MESSKLSVYLVNLYDDYSGNYLTYLNVCIQVNDRAECTRDSLPKIMLQ
jgi:hypothetical protein